VQIVEAPRAIPWIGTPPPSTSLASVASRGLDGIHGVDVAHVLYSGGSVVGGGVGGAYG